MACEFKKNSDINKKMFQRVVTRLLEVICAKDGLYIFINNNMDIFEMTGFKQYK